MDPYRLLGIDESCTESELKQRWKALRKIYHPDKCKLDKTATAIYQMLEDAYTKIKNVKEPIVLSKIQPTNPGKHSEIEIQTSSDVTTVGRQLLDPYFHPEFSLSELFGDVAIPEHAEKTKHTSSEPSTSVPFSSNACPSSSQRTQPRASKRQK